MRSKNSHLTDWCYKAGVTVSAITNKSSDMSWHSCVSSVQKTVCKSYGSAFDTIVHQYKEELPRATTFLCSYHLHFLAALHRQSSDLSFLYKLPRERKGYPCRSHAFGWKLATTSLDQTNTYRSQQIDTKVLLTAMSMGKVGLQHVLPKYGLVGSCQRTTA